MAGKPDANTAVFMDNANDGDYEGLVEVYEKSSEAEKKGLLEYTNAKASASALHLAANNGHEDIVQFICDCITKDFPAMKDVLINKQNKFKFTPLMSACFRGYMTKGTKKDAEQDRI